MKRRARHAAHCYFEQLGGAVAKVGALKLYDSIRGYHIVTDCRCVAAAADITRHFAEVRHERDVRRANRAAIGEVEPPPFHAQRIAFGARHAAPTAISTVRGGRIVTVVIARAVIPERRAERARIIACVAK